MAVNMRRRFHKIVFEKIIGKIFYEGREKSLCCPNIFRKSVRRFNQNLNERGVVVPWIYNKKECLEFWSSIDNSSPSTGNRPEKYSSKKKGILVCLDNFWSPDVKKTDSILEVGCNCGANLYWLNRLGYTALSGVGVFQRV
jgi:hypothetical protein